MVVGLTHRRNFLRRVLLVQSGVCVFMVHQHVERLRKLLWLSKSKCADGEAKLSEAGQMPRPS
jgi:hypothetical protein